VSVPHIVVMESGAFYSPGKIQGARVESACDTT